MWETEKVTLEVFLPADIAEQAREVQREDPDFLGRVVLFGLTRRSIYSQLRERHQGTDELPPAPSVDWPIHEGVRACCGVSFDEPHHEDCPDPQSFAAEPREPGEG